MAIKREVAYGIVRSLAEFWKSEELHDFTVKCGSAEFKCHRLLLAACSGFFRALFRSGMLETEEKCVTVEDISSETFELILEAMYTGHGVLTNDNVIDIWSAANQLQILFLMAECEAFVIHSLCLDNYVDYFYASKLLSSGKVTETVWNFILFHSDVFLKTETFLELSAEELLNLVKSQDLKVASEDLVIESILRWVDHVPSALFIDHDSDPGSVNKLGQPFLDTGSGKKAASRGKPLELARNVIKTEEFITKVKVVNAPTAGNKTDETAKEDFNAMPFVDASEMYFHIDVSQVIVEYEGQVAYPRSDRLASLLSAARTCLASIDCLQRTMKHPRVQNDSEAQEIILKAVFHNAHPGHGTGQWLSSSVHRNCSKLENVALACVNGEDRGLDEIRAFSFARNKWFTLLPVPENSVLGRDFDCVNIRGAVNIFGMDDEDAVRFSFSNGTWKMKRYPFIGEDEGNEKFLLSATDRYVYVVVTGDHDHDDFLRIDLASDETCTFSSPPSGEKDIVHVATYMNNKILVFYTDTVTEPDDFDDTPDRVETSKKDETSEKDEKVEINETYVQLYDTVSETWTRLNNIEGPAESLVTFRNDHHLFILQTCGFLWRVVQPQSDDVDFEYVDKLWGSHFSLLGAVTHFEDLYIFGQSCKAHESDPHQMKSLPGIFNQIRYIHIESEYCSGVSPAIVPKKYLKYD